MSENSYTAHVRDSLPLLREGLLDSKEAASIQSHLETCADCFEDWTTQLRVTPLRDQLSVEDLAGILPAGDESKHASEETLWRMADVEAGPPPPNDLLLWPHVLNCRTCYLALARCRAALKSEVQIDEDLIRDIGLAVVDRWRALQLKVFLSVVGGMLDVPSAQRALEHGKFRIRLGTGSRMRMLSETTSASVETFERSTDEPFEIHRSFGNLRITLTVIPRDMLRRLFEIRVRIDNETHGGPSSDLRVVVRSIDGEELANLVLSADEISIGLLPLGRYDIDLIDQGTSQLIGLIQLTPDQ